MTTTAPGVPSAAAPLESPLLPEHVRAGAVLTTFAGWTMPLRYGSELSEHRAVRERAGLFDLSHMAQLEVTGPEAAAVLDRSLVSLVSALPVGRARYTVLTDSRGGILDDLVVYRLGEEDFLVVANAVNRLSVRDELTRRGQGYRGAVVDRTPLRALLACQGPAAASVVQKLVPIDLATLRYYGITSTRLGDVPVLLARTGYTGEDGFEVSVPAAAARDAWSMLLHAGEAFGAVPCGLASRDTLRLEAGMALYGHELTTDVTPFDVGLARLVHLDHEFVGRGALAERAGRSDGRTLVGLQGSGRRAARSGNAVRHDDREVGVVTSGALSPTLGYPIAMAIVQEQVGDVGTEVVVDVRGSRQAMRVVALPFYRRTR